MSANKEARSLLSGRVLPGHSSRNDFSIEGPRAALLIIDIQDYLSRPAEPSTNFSNYEEGNTDQYLFHKSLPSAIKNVEILLSSFRQVRQGKHVGTESGKPEIIFTYLEAVTEDCRDISMDYKLSGPKLSVQLPTPTKPAIFLPNVSPMVNEIRIPKTSCSVFLSTNINYILKNLNVEQLVICGQVTNQCVESACRDAADLGYFVTVVHDACAAHSLQDHQLGLSNMKGFARILSTEQVVKELVLSDTASENVSIGAKDQAVQVTKSSIGNTGKTLAFSNASAIPSVLPIHHQTIKSILLALRAAQVQFLRYTALDCTNGIRCKAVPLPRLIPKPDTIHTQVCVAEVCFGGMPGFCDMILKDSGLSARNVLVLRPDLNSLRILPYSPSSALVMCTLHNQITGVVSPFCTRSLLKKVVDTALERFGISFFVGVELEFVLARTCNPLEPVDYSVFANTITLDEQEGFLVALYKWLTMLDIPISQIHSESAPGQLEVVLAHQNDALQMADQVILAKETICACAKLHGLCAIFLPKVFSDQAGNGLHIHLSFRQGASSQNAFVDRSRRFGISSMGEALMEGILVHLPALTSITLPSTNSFRRVGQGCWTGSTVAWSLEDKEVPLRVCIDAELGYPTNVEYKLCDASCNIYLALASILGCALDGIAQHMKLRSISSEAAEPVQDILCSDLHGALLCLQTDAFLFDLLGEQLSKGYVAVKMAEIERTKDLTLEQELNATYRG